MVSVFSLLKIEQMEIGLDLIVAWEKEFIFEKSILDINTESFMLEMHKAVQQAVNLCINIGYITKETANIAITKAFIEAKAIALHTNIISADTIGDVMAKAVRESKLIDEIMKKNETEAS